jgi:hypothetical protein
MAPPSLSGKGRLIMDEYARGFSQAVNNFRALIQGRLDAYEGQKWDEASYQGQRIATLRDILLEDIQKMEGLAHSLTLNGYNKRVVDLVNNVMGLAVKP